MASDGAGSPSLGLAGAAVSAGGVSTFRLLVPKSGEGVKATGRSSWLSTRRWRVRRVLLLCLGMQSPVVISDNCNYLLPPIGGETNRLFPAKLLFVFPARVPGRKSAFPGKGDWHWAVCHGHLGQARL